MSASEITLLHFGSDNYTLGFSYEKQTYQVLKLVFGKDGSIYLSNPYYGKANRLISNMMLEGAGTRTQQGRYKHIGGSLDELVKTSLHTSGHSHTEQIGSRQKFVRKKGPSLRDFTGHLFTIQLKGIQHFTSVSEASFVSQKRKEKINLRLNSIDGRMYKIVGMLSIKKAFLNTMPQLGKTNLGPVFTQTNPQGLQETNILISPSVSDVFQEKVLVLQITETPKFSTPSQSTWLLYTGFDDPHIVTDVSKPTSLTVVIETPVE
ncbi:hypothetical protein [Turneriella parva]|uniref:Uncharacterized protein n=1 Tax=Turneriella parva (strain ATCC BAA-1111 / DSM 21527 / NCTC 11395 / H) TaxID=869212 RepID=I4B1R0_TURPD|nr:hypothetical protein [Turneriella parva]AFM11217.1 hypothetical protein Turpa_0565 [Turneriella parva DSM 21527]